MPNPMEKRRGMRPTAEEVGRFENFCLYSDAYKCVLIYSG